MLNKLYWYFAYLGSMAVVGSFFLGFRFDATASNMNYLFNIGLYLAFFIIHMVMTLPGFKKLVFGSPQGTSRERRIYVTVSIITWIIVMWLHKPVPGIAFLSPWWLQYLGICMMLFSVFAFFEYANFEMMDSFIGIPGSELSHSTGSETPLMTEGSYASVRHPMYRAMTLLMFSSLLVYPHTGQLLFVILLSASFILFVPIEERLLIKARGEEYRAYMAVTRYRLFRWIW